MRVVDRKTFLTLPAGTFYCKGERWVFDSICIKDDSLANDWYYLNPAWPAAQDSEEAFDLLDKSLDSGISFPCEDATGRDGCFDETDIFLVFEADDLKALRGHIDRALSVGQQRE
jgi:hypothetical protein